MNRDQAFVDSSYRLLQRLLLSCHRRSDIAGQPRKPGRLQKQRRHKNITHVAEKVANVDGQFAVA